LGNALLNSGVYGIPAGSDVEKMWVGVNVGNNGRSVADACGNALVGVNVGKGKRVAEISNVEDSDGDVPLHAEMMMAVNNKVMNLEMIFMGFSCFVEIKTKPMETLFPQNNNLLEKEVVVYCIVWLVVYFFFLSKPPSISAAPAS
jgi:hypothetical protein